MKAFTISCLVAFLAATAQGAPAPAPLDARFKAVVTFEGADPDASFTHDVTTSGSFTINNNLSVSHIKIDGDATCTFYGTEGSVTTVLPGGTSDVGPPQPQAWGTCTIG